MLEVSSVKGFGIIDLVSCIMACIRTMEVPERGPDIGELGQNKEILVAPARNVHTAEILCG